MRTTEFYHYHWDFETKKLCRLCQLGFRGYDMYMPTVKFKKKEDIHP
jgi:hypothetical protein